jgi:hypothetical protein
VHAGTSAFFMAMACRPETGRRPGIACRCRSEISPSTLQKFPYREVEQADFLNFYAYLQ